jgi:hypothetical protein
MRPIIADTQLVACCGLYCGACGAYLKEKCKGCRGSEKNSWCKVKQCVLQKKISTCADCGEYPNPMDCKKFNNFISRLFGLLFNSNRAACVKEIKQSGLDIYSRKMADLRRQTFPRA